MNFNGSLLVIPGFLGAASDWEDVLPHGVPAAVLDLFSASSSSETPPAFDFVSLARWVNKNAQNIRFPRILIGYSLGGRIAFHALLESPDLWSGAVIVSANPGFSDPGVKEERLQADVEWAKKFEHGDWDAVLKEWNSQPVFNGGAIEPVRMASSYSRVSLASALRDSSLGLQKDLRAPLQQFDKPILYIVGENDPRFRGYATELGASHPNIHTAVVRQSGHRVLFDQPQKLKRMLTDFLEQTGVPVL